MRKTALLILVSASNLLAAPPIDPTGLYLREDFRVLPPATCHAGAHRESELTLHLYGAGAGSVKKGHHKEKADDPFYAWSGQCAKPWAIAFRKADAPSRLKRTRSAVSRGYLEFSADALFHFENAGRLDREQSRRGGVDEDLGKESRTRRVTGQSVGRWVLGVGVAAEPGVGV